MTFVIVIRVLVVLSMSIDSFAFALSVNEKKEDNLIRANILLINHLINTSDHSYQRRGEENAKFLPEDYIRSLEIYLGGTIGSYFLC